MSHPSPSQLQAQAQTIIDACRASGLKLVTAESLTGGLIAATLTGIPGASNVVERAFITYSYASKSQMLGVSAELVARCEAVSEEVARAMAEWALARVHPHADLAVAVTGVAGPGSASPIRPAGLVHIAAARAGQPTRHRRYEFGDIGRDEVRACTVGAALELVQALISEPSASA